MTNFHEQFQPDPELDGERRLWTTAKPIIQNAVVAFAPPYPDYPKLRTQRQASCDPCSPSARDVGGEVEVAMYCTNENGFGDYQENAWNFILDNAEAIEASLRRKLLAHHLKFHKQFLEEVLPDDRKTKNYWKKIEGELDWTNASAINSLYKLVGIGLVDNGLDECGFSSFEFQTGWDRDHGAGILMHKDNVLAAGGMGEYICRSPGLVDSMKAVQMYDFDEGDFKL